MHNLSKDRQLAYVSNVDVEREKEETKTIAITRRRRHHHHHHYYHNYRRRAINDCSFSLAQSKLHKDQLFALG